MCLKSESMRSLPDRWAAHRDVGGSRIPANVAFYQRFGLTAVDRALPLLPDRRSPGSGRRRRGRRDGVVAAE